MEWVKRMIARLTASKPEPEALAISSDMMITVSSGILDTEMMDGLVEEFNAHQGMGIYCMGNLVFNAPYDKLKGLGIRTYFVAPTIAEDFRARAMIAENAGQPLDRKIVALSPEVDPKALDVVGEYFGAIVLKLKPNEKLFKNFTLCSVPPGLADQFRQKIAVQGQFSLEFVN